ncbi:MAG: hypothetical protein GTO63_03970 [Anaerolineae bacterium]|nr:hypothetical protein [Anaerolineae bacterium]NIN94170.1 hypothetical protein [Anaerolineae bacterium]NIQ77212.1 hypothetical protein [Anaerolineae bacterium]
MSAIVAALIDVGFVFLLAWRVRPRRFRELKWALVVGAVIFWSALWAWVLWSFWNCCYSYVFPTWARWLIPPAYGLLFGGSGLALWWLALRLPGSPVLGFCVLGGLVSLPGHLWAIYGRQMLEKVPLLQAVSPFSALVFGVPEFIFYWSIIIVIAVLLRWAWEWSRRLMRRGAGVP